ncbi:hypothetical protein, partial [Cronobacter turicensis]
DRLRLRFTRRAKPEDTLTASE